MVVNRANISWFIVYCGKIIITSKLTRDGNRKYYTRQLYLDECEDGKADV